LGYIGTGFLLLFLGIIMLFISLSDIKQQIQFIKEKNHSASWLFILWELFQVSGEGHGSTFITLLVGILGVFLGGGILLIIVIGYVTH